MPVTFNKDLLGTFTLEQNGNEFPIEIRRGNCLAVMIFDKGDSYMLYNFFADEAHVKAIIRNSDHPKPLFHGVDLPEIYPVTIQGIQLEFYPIRWLY